MAQITKQDGVNISLGAVLAWLPLIPVFWFIAKPILVSAVSDAVAEDIEQQISKQIAPLNGAFIALLQTEVATLKRQIAAKEFKRDNPPPGDWTSLDAQELVNDKLALKAAEDALVALKS